jgi:ankyrin repeat protein
MDAKQLPARPNLDHYKKQAKDLLKAWKAGDIEALGRVRQFHPRLNRRSHETLRSADFALADAQLVLAREYGFESWPRFASHIEAVRGSESPVSNFEFAVDAIVAGDLATLRSLLRGHPDLVRARSTRQHCATLLHYVSANGMEDYRQKTPKNIVAIAALLLDAGAEVDATGEMYGGGSTALGLTATSIHPARAGVLAPLIDLLIARGAAVDAPMSIVRACLGNDRPEGAVLMAERGARLDLETAAGVGRLDIVSEYFDSNGRLTAGATQEQLDRGFTWACEYGRRTVVDFLIDRGVNLRAGENTDQTALHLAAHHAELDIVKLLIARGAPLEAKNGYDGTVLGQTTWSCRNSGLDVDYAPVIETLLEAGADVHEAGYPTGNERVDELLLRYGVAP